MKVAFLYRRGLFGHYGWKTCSFGRWFCYVNDDGITMIFIKLWRRCILRLRFNYNKKWLFKYPMGSVEK